MAQGTAERVNPGQCGQQGGVLIPDKPRAGQMRVGKSLFQLETNLHPAEHQVEMTETAET